MLALASLVSTAGAFPTSNPFPGPTGLGIIPTTRTVAPGAIELGLQYERVDIDAGGDVDLLPDASATLGLRRGEIGAVYVREEVDSGGFESKNNYFALHGKYLVVDAVENVRRPQVAVGAHFYEFGSDAGIDLGNVASLYAVGSLRLDRRFDRPEQLRGHLGLLVQRIDTGDGGDDETELRPFVGVEYFVSPQFTLAADFLAKSGDAQEAYSLVGRYEPQGANSRFNAQIGVGRLDEDTKFFIGATYRFGGPDTGTRAASATAAVPATTLSN